MRQLIIATIILSILCGCDNQVKKDNSIETKNKVENETKSERLENNDKANEWNYKEVKQTYIDSLLIDICQSQDFEFIDLYPTLDSISSDKYENLVLVDSLKTKGFKVTNWGRGNWMEGPRIVSFTMTNEQCECQVDKLYYSTDKEGAYKITERIKCKKASR